MIIDCCRREAGRQAPRNRPTGRLPGVALGLLGLLLVLGCSSADAPVGSVGGLRFGAARPADCQPLRVPLPSALARTLAYCRRPGPEPAYAGASLADAVWGFYEDRFFALSATVAAPGQAAALRNELTRRYGRPYCRDAPKLAVCLWRAGDADAVLEVPADAPARFLLRHRELAARVAKASGEAAPAPDEPAAPTVAPDFRERRDARP